MRAFETLVIVLLAAKTGLAVINFWRLARMESNMATKEDLEQAVADVTSEFDGLMADLDAEIGQILDALNQNQPTTTAVEKLAELRVKVQQTRGRVKGIIADEAEPVDTEDDEDAAMLEGVHDTEQPQSFEAALDTKRGKK